MNLESEIKARGTQDVINDNEQFHEWIIENLTLSDVLSRCDNVLLEILEEYNNDWIEAVEAYAEEAGIDSNKELLRALLTDVHDEYGIECTEQGAVLAIYKASGLYSVEYSGKMWGAEAEVEILDADDTLDAMADFCELPARWYHVRYGADS